MPKEIKIIIPKSIYQILSFFIVGSISTIADWATFAGLYKIFHIAQWLSLLVAFSLGAIINFIINKRVTFKNQSTDKLQPAVFFTIAAAMYFVSLIAMAIITRRVDPIIARMITTGIVFVINFFLHKTITFGKFK
jgi:putative flippase GtrA